MKDMKYVIDNPIEPQTFFIKLMEIGNLTYGQMYEIFNMGIGYVVIIDEESKRDFMSIMKNRVEVQEIGHVENGSGISIPNILLNFTVIINFLALLNTISLNFVIYYGLL